MATMGPHTAAAAAAAAVSRFDFVHLPLYEAWLVTSAAFYHAGVFVRLHRPYAALVFLTWFSKPLLLLYALLFSTLGVYINDYTFGLLDTAGVVGALLVPTSGYVAARLAATLSSSSAGGGGVDARTACSESAMCNCVLVFAMTRLTLSVPDSDTVSVLPFWMTFLSPVPLVADALLRAVGERFGRRRDDGAGRTTAVDGRPGAVGDDRRRSRRRSSGDSSQANAAAAAAVEPVSCVSTGVQSTPVTDTPPPLETVLVDQKVTVL